MTEHEHCIHAYSTECCECAGEHCWLEGPRMTPLEAFWVRRIEEPAIRAYLRFAPLLVIALVCVVGMVIYLVVSR